MFRLLRSSERCCSEQKQVFTETGGTNTTRRVEIFSETTPELGAGRGNQYLCCTKGESVATGDISGRKGEEEPKTKRMLYRYLRERKRDIQQSPIVSEIRS